MIESAITKVCSVCGQTKPTSDFYRHPSTRDGLDRKCKDCRRSASRKWKAENCGRARETDRRWRQQNRERANAHYRRWRKKNKEKHLKLCRKWNAANRERRQRRARLRVGQSYSEAEWQALLAMFGYRCAACGVDARATREGFLTPDHVIPVCMGGPNTIDNIQPLCLDCNRRKNGRFIDYCPDWAR
jgi:hypothetical protein